MINMAISSKLLSVKLEHDVNPPYVRQKKLSARRINNEADLELSQSISLVHHQCLSKYLFFSSPEAYCLTYPWVL